MAIVTGNSAVGLLDKTLEMSSSANSENLTSPPGVTYLVEQELKTSNKKLVKKVEILVS